jgi:hypothetical protein
MLSFDRSEELGKFEVKKILLFLAQIESHKNRRYAGIKQFFDLG